MKPQEVKYIIRHYSRFMTLMEKAAYKHLAGTIKATLGRSDTAAQEEARASQSFSGSLTEDSEARVLTKDGYESFVQKTAERILAEHKEQVFLNCCPRCHELTRTPTAVPFLRLRLALSKSNYA